MNNPTLPRDQNGDTIAALAPRTSSNHSLSSTFAEVLAKDDTHTRIVVVANTSGDSYVRLNTTDSVGQLIPKGASIAIKVDAGLALQAKGSGTLNVSVQG